MWKIEQNCIYKIQIEGTDAVYIGQAESSIERWARHIIELKAGTHHNSGLLALIRQYGILALRFEVLLANIAEKKMKETFRNNY